MSVEQVSQVKKPGKPKAKEVRLEPTMRERAYAINLVKLKSKRAAIKAAYNVNGNDSADVLIQKIEKRPAVQHALEIAIRDAGLDNHSLMKELSKVVFQDDDLSAKRLAIRDTVEYVGGLDKVNKQVVLKIESQFFKDIIEGEQA